MDEADDDTLYAERRWWGWCVRDTSNQRWHPHTEAQAEISNAADPERAVLRMCRNQPERGTWFT